MRILAYLEKKKEVWMALFLSVIFFLLRFPSLFEPNWYGDEGIYQAIGRALRAGKVLYAGTWDNKPPTIYYIYAFFDANQFQIRLFALGIGVLSLIAFFYLSQKLLADKKAALLATGMFIFLFATPVLEGNITNAENLMLLPSIVALLFFYRYSQRFLEPLVLSRRFNDGQKKLLGIGVILGLSFTIKIVAVFDVGTILILLLCILVPKDIRHLFRAWKPVATQYVAAAFPLLVGFILPIGVYGIYFLLTGTFSSFYTAVFTGNVNYVGYQNTFIIPQGLLVLRTLLLGIAIIFILLNRKKLTFETQVLLTWGAFSLYSTFFSNRPYPHYLILLIPTVCLFAGYIYKRRSVPLTISAVIFIACIISYFQVSWAKNPLTYYTNFISFVTQQKTVEQYQSYFDGNVPRDYAVADYIKRISKPEENVFIWGNSAQIYVLAHKVPPGKYTVAYHIAYNKQATEETNNALSVVKPEFVVILPDEKEKPFSLANYRYVMTIKDTAIYERIH